MMRAGKDYVAGVPEYEDSRSAHLLELLRTVKAQTPPAEDPESSEVDAPIAKSTNQNKPTLKLTK